MRAATQRNSALGRASAAPGATQSGEGARRRAGMILQPAPSNTRSKIQRVRIRDEELELPAAGGRDTPATRLRGVVGSVATASPRRGGWGTVLGRACGLFSPKSPPASRASTLRVMT